MEGGHDRPVAPRLPPGFARHWRLHQSPECPRCTWARLRGNWLARTPVCREFHAHVSWIEVLPPDSEKWGLGCWVCRQQAARRGFNAGGFANYAVRTDLTLARLLRHEHTAGHLRAVQAHFFHLGLTTDPAGDGLPAPASADFLALLDRVTRGELEAQTRGGRKRSTSMAWCLYEAFREEERAFLDKAICMSVAQDASTRGHMLLTRYVACSPNMERRSGVLRITPAKAAGAVDLARAVRKAVRSMAYMRVPHAGLLKLKKAAALVEDLAGHLEEITEVFVADGAADEQLAGRMLHPQSQRSAPGDGQSLALPNLRLVVRDGAHAARRLLERTLPKDPYIKNVLTVLIWSKDSLAKLIQHSQAHQDIWQKLQVELRPDYPVLKNLGYAEHRFDSFSRPLRRMVVHFHAFICTANVIILERARISREHQGANRALEALDIEGMLQLGMVADACQRVEGFIRFLDKESFDWADLPGRISALKDTCRAWFERRAVLQHDGFTKAMLKWIGQPRLVMLSNGRPKMFGRESGPTGEEMDKCFARMVNWWSLAEEVLKTEFPAWHIQMAFEVFKLPRPLTVSQDTRRRLASLAKLCQVEREKLLSEYLLMLPVVNDVFKDTKGPSCTVWARAVQHTKAEHKRRRDIPCTHLLQVLARYSAYAGSSSGVEQQFSQCLALFRHLRNGSPMALQRILVLHGAQKLPWKEKCQLVAKARVIWAEYFGAPRRSRQVTCRRLGALKRRAAWQGMSEAAMLRRHRRDPVCAPHTRTPTEDDPVAARLWKSPQQKEFDRQLGMQEARRLEGADLGFDLEPLAEAHSERLNAHREKAQKTALQYQQRQKRLAAIRDTRPVNVAPGTRAFAAADCRSEELLAMMARHRLLHEHNLPRACLFIVAELDRPPANVDLVATLLGGMAMHPHAFNVPNPQAVCYGRAFRKRRHLWISPECRAESPRTVAMMQNMIDEEKRVKHVCNWTISACDLSTFVRKHRARSRNEVLAVVAHGQQRPALQGLVPRQCVTLHQLRLNHKEVQLARLAGALGNFAHPGPPWGAGPCTAGASGNGAVRTRHRLCTLPLCRHRAPHGSITGRGAPAPSLHGTGHILHAGCCMLSCVPNSTWFWAPPKFKKAASDNSVGPRHAAAATWSDGFGGVLHDDLNVPVKGIADRIDQGRKAPLPRHRATPFHAWSCH